uniref:Uncharacterized protein n=1 Tax=uncultured marine microorganism HF4000_ANIW137I15 TaxID=455531 RepID=B3T4N6_9ZZZZ|nr:hypothetical protein ALOHA_HF4000ANIW137I15ctg2g4 [uncultured marine microorganism HF4000_ANIW137I15]
MTGLSTLGIPEPAIRSDFSEFFPTIGRTGGSAFSESGGGGVREAGRVIFSGLVLGRGFGADGRLERSGRAAGPAGGGPGFVSPGCAPLTEGGVSIEILFSKTRRVSALALSFAGGEEGGTIGMVSTLEDFFSVAGTPADRETDG